MRERFYYLLIIILLASVAINAQVPVIQKIESRISFPKSVLVITGSGFGTNASQIQVWFDQVKASNILSVTNLSIEVEVPSQARFNNVSVINTTTNLSSESSLKYMPAFSGEGFEASKLDAKSISIPTSNLFFIATADIDGDNKPDVIGSRNQFVSPITATNLVVLLNQSTIGNINLVSTPATNLNLNFPTSFLTLKDLNGDGKPDLIASRSGGSAGNNVLVFLNKSTVGSPNFEPAPNLQLDAGHFAQEIGVGDLNGDGKPEIVITNGTSNVLYVFPNSSSGGNLKIDLPKKITVEGALNTLAVEIQDIDSDGDRDIITSALQGANIYILKNLGALEFSSQKISVSNSSINDLITSDFNEDGQLDIAFTNVFSDDVRILLNKSTPSLIDFPNTITVATDDEPFGIDVGDLNGDGFPDIVVTCREGKTINTFLHNKSLSSLTFTKITIPTAKRNWYAKAGDLDGDTKPDIISTSFLDRDTGPFSLDIFRNKNCHLPKILNEGPLTICSSQTILLKTIPIPGHTFDWKANGFSQANILNPPSSYNALGAADYTVTASGPDGCSVISNTITINSGAGSLPATPTITSPINAICEGKDFTLATNPVSGGASYIWKGPTGNTLPNLASVPLVGTIANAGIYSLTIKVGDCSSNTVTKRVDVVSMANFSITSSNASNSICDGQSLTLTVNSEPGYNYEWFKNNVSTGDTNPSLIINQVSQAGTYKTTVTNTALGCSKETNAIAVSVFAKPTAAFTIPATSCVDDIISFTNTSTPTTNVSYSWNFGDNTTNSTSDLKEPTHAYATAQSFSPKLTVSYTGNAGCSDSITKTIIIIKGVTPVITAPTNELCRGGAETLTLSATATGILKSYLWSTNETFAAITVTEPQDYSVETLDENGCKGFDKITITEKVDCTPIENAIPPLFTPNGDTQNDRWVIPGIENKVECTMNIFDGRGRRILLKKGYPVEGWDGVSDEGKEVPEGTYFYVLSCPDETPVTGSVLVVR